MTEIPPYLFIVTSTALVLGVAITIRGLLGFRPLAADAATGAAGAQDPSDTSGVSDTPDPTGSPDAAPAPPATYQVRDLREPIVMTIAGVLICVFTSLAIAALIHSV